MGSQTVVKQWADGPFRLIETPEFREKTSSHVDPYIRAASIMAIYHNMLIRGLNSIYLQAPHIVPCDYKDFIAYCDCWFQNIDSEFWSHIFHMDLNLTIFVGHHHDEETIWFPKIEEAAGEKGILDANVEQHAIFEPGIEAFHTYLTSLNGHEHSFSSSHLLAIIDDFAPALLQHLSDEIPSLLSLSRFGSSLPILEITSAESRAASKSLAKTGPVMFFFTNLDLTFEDGLWADWPPIPWPVRWALGRVFGSWNRGWWRFSSCDIDGKPQPLYAIDKICG